MTTVPPSMFGLPVLRTEDPRFLRGRARYLDNIPIEGALRAVFVRSIMPHARLNGVDVAEARAMPGVVAVLLADDIDLPPMPPSGNVEASHETLEGPFGREVLARDTVRFVGEAIGVVVAETLAQALDAAETVFPDYDPLPAVTDVEAAVAEDAPLLWPAFGTNVAHAFEDPEDDDVLAGADVVVRGRFVNQRLAPVPMETNGIAVIPEPGGGFTVYVSTQVPFDVRDDLAEALGVEKAQVRAIAPDVGGGFGAKLQVYPEYLVVARAAQILGRPVRWVESRTESMLNLTHGRAQVQRVELGATRGRHPRRDARRAARGHGRVPDRRLHAQHDAGDAVGRLSFPRDRVHRPQRCDERHPGRARTAARDAPRPRRSSSARWTCSPTELGMDPAELRRKNLIAPDAFPFTTASGTTYDVGDYEPALDEALRRADYAGLRAAQQARRTRGDHLALGIGICSYVEITSFSSKEFGSVEVRPDGAVIVMAGTSSHGQGHETAFAQIVSAVLGVPMERITVIHSDTGVVPRGPGHVGVALPPGRRLRRVRARDRGVGEGAHPRRAPARGRRGRRRRSPRTGGSGSPAPRSVRWGGTSSPRRRSDPTRLPDGMEPGLAAAGRFRMRGLHVPVRRARRRWWRWTPRRATSGSCAM